MQLRILDVNVRVHCSGAPAYLLRKNFGAMSLVGEDAEFEYDVTHDGESYRICATDGTVIDAGDDGAFLYHFEKHLTISLQRRRPDLYFLHAAALERDGKAHLLIAPSGVGKSTTAWALLHHGFGYLSDELAPIDLATGRVQPYPHALCLKSQPPAPYNLPPGRVLTSRTLHLPPWQTPARTIRGAIPVETLFFLRRSTAGAPSLQPISAGEATAQIYANALNALAHSGFGLDGAVALAGRCRTYALSCGDLHATAQLLSTRVGGRVAA